MTYTRSTKTNVHIEGILKTHKNKTYEHSMNINFSLQTDFKTFQTFSSLHAYTHTHMRFKMSAKKKTEGFLLEQTEKKKKRRSNEQQKQQQRRWRPKKKKWWWWHILLYYDVSLLLTTRIEYRMKWIKARKGNEKRVKISIICGNELEGDNNNKSENFSIQIANQSFVAWDSCIFNGKYFFLCVNVCVWWAFNHGLEMRDNMHTHVCVAKSIDSIDFGFFFSTFRFFFFLFQPHHSFLLPTVFPMICGRSAICAPCAHTPIDLWLTFCSYRFSEMIPIHFWKRQRKQ